MNIKERNQKYEENNNRGIDASNHSFLLGKGTNYVLAAGLHSVETLMKSKDKPLEKRSAHIYTGAITELAAELSNSHFITRLGYGEYIKPSSSYGKVYDIVDRNNIEFVSDLTGFSDSKKSDIYIGIGEDDSNIEGYEEIKELIIKQLEEKLGAIINFNSYKASKKATLAGNIKLNRDISSAQFYVSARYRNAVRFQYNTEKFIECYAELLSEINEVIVRKRSLRKT